MKTKKQIEVSYKECVNIPEFLENGTVYISREYPIGVHLCLCGCRKRSVTPLVKGEWSADITNGKLTMKPSVLNRSCRTHYIITNGIANIV